MKIRKYSDDIIFEFDTLDELRVFDKTYISDTRSEILKAVAAELSCSESDIKEVTAYKDINNEAAGFTFKCGENKYSYSYNDKTVRRQ